jgi:hypothetical protein
MYVPFSAVLTRPWMLLVHFFFLAAPPTHLRTVKGQANAPSWLEIILLPTIPAALGKENVLSLIPAKIPYLPASRKLVLSGQTIVR